MTNFFEFLQHNVDYFILGLLGLMSFIMIWFVVERFIFLNKVDVSHYSNIHQLDIDLQNHLTIISTIGSNAPYVGLLGTVISILLTFYTLGNSGGDIDASAIMLNLSLALKATAVGIMVAIPSMVFYNALTRKVEVNRLKWKALNSQKQLTEQGE